MDIILRKNQKAESLRHLNSQLLHCKYFMVLKIPLNWVFISASYCDSRLWIRVLRGTDYKSPLGDIFLLRITAGLVMDSRMESPSPTGRTNFIIEPVWGHCFLQGSFRKQHESNRIWVPVLNILQFIFHLDVDSNSLLIYSHYERKYYITVRKTGMWMLLCLTTKPAESYSLQNCFILQTIFQSQIV